MKLNEFIDKWVVAYESKEQKEEFAIEIVKDIESLEYRSDASKDARIWELEELLKSDSVYTLLRFGFKSPSFSGLDDCEDKKYIELYDLIRKLR